MFVSRDWLAAVYSMRGLEHGGTLRSENQISAALASRLARHVASIGDRYNCLLFTRAQLQRIASRMPFLRQLAIKLQSGEEWSAEERLSLPATLSEVSIRFDATASATSVFIFFFSSLLSLLHECVCQTRHCSCALSASPFVFCRAGLISISPR